MTSEATLRSLSQLREGPCISIYLPTHPRGAEVQEGPVHLKNLLSEARARAAEQGLDAATIAALLDPAGELLSGPGFWEYQRQGLALLASDEGIGVHRVPVEVEPFVYVGTRFCVRPLLPMVRRGAACFVLALSGNAVRLLRCTMRTVERIESPALPRELGRVEHERAGQAVHAGGAHGRAVYHGQGVGEIGEEDLVRSVREVDQAVRAVIPAGTPLILAGVDRLRGLYAEHSGYRFLAEEGIAGNPEPTADAELRDQAVVIAARELDRPRRAALRRIADAPPASVARGLDDVIGAARAGRVDWLVARPERPLWGLPPSSLSGSDVHDERRSGDDDLIDLAIAEALATGAHVGPASGDELPEADAVAALLRY